MCSYSSRVCGGLAVLLLATAPRAQAQELDANLSFLKPLLGTTWVGRYVPSDEDDVTHVVHWEAILSGKAVRKTKRVPELNFAEENLYYWDWEENAVVFAGVTNRGQVLRGTIYKEEGLIVLRGAWTDDETSHEFALTLEVLPDGRLQDKYYNIVDGAWQQGHLIDYRREGDPRR
ncbi:MAG: hypothetical protein JSV86_13400 [Gemmatimonadota bacterium]|nr:MAG: hypothetical protein JSV86_13400 [Gemmatimonadota bacterium]